jgi:hypothetical protein
MPGAARPTGRSRGRRTDGRLRRMGGLLRRMGGLLRRMDGRLRRTDGRLGRMDGRLRSPVPGRTARDRGRGTGGRFRRAAPGHLAAMAHGHGVRESRAAAAGPGAAARDAARGAAAAGAAACPGAAAGSPRTAEPRGAGLRQTQEHRGAGTVHAVGTHRPVLSAREMTAWAAGPAGRAGRAVPSQGPVPGAGRPDTRAAVAPPPCGQDPPTAWPRQARREVGRPPWAP